MFFIKAIKSKFHTNKFNEKDLFTARKLFKGNERLSGGSKGKNNDLLKTITEEGSMSYDAENAKQRDSCQTAFEHRSSYNSGIAANSNNTQHIDGERIHGGVLRRNHHNRNTDDEPEIVSMFSADKSEDYVIQNRKFMKPHFEDKPVDRIGYYKEKEKAMFGYGDHDDMPKFAPPKMQKRQTEEPSVKDLKLKFDFAESESEYDDEISENPREEIGNEYGRQTIDLNGPFYDPSLLSKQSKACISELGRAESEADDVN